VAKARSKHIFCHTMWVEHSGSNSTYRIAHLMDVVESRSLRDASEDFNVQNIHTGSHLTACRRIPKFGLESKPVSRILVCHVIAEFWRSIERGRMAITL